MACPRSYLKHLQPKCISKVKSSVISSFSYLGLLTAYIAFTAKSNGDSVDKSMPNMLTRMCTAAEAHGYNHIWDIIYVL